MKTSRNYANYDALNFCEDLKGVYLNPTHDASVLEGDNENTRVNYLWDFFQKAFISIANRHVPDLHKRVRGADSCPWSNSDIKRDMRERDFKP